MAFEFEPNTLKHVEGFVCDDCNVGDGAWCMRAGHCPNRDGDKGPTATEFEELDRLGPVLCRLGVDQVNLSFLRLTPGERLYHIDGRKQDGVFFSGAGATPSEAYRHAMRDVAARGSGGIYVDA